MAAKTQKTGMKDTRKKRELDGKEKKEELPGKQKANNGS